MNYEEVTICKFFGSPRSCIFCSTCRYLHVKPTAANMKLWTRRTTTTFQESTSILQTVDVSQVVAPQMMGASQGENRQAMGTSNEEAPPMMGNSQEVALPSMGASYRKSPPAIGELGNNQKKRPRPSKHLRERKRKTESFSCTTKCHPRGIKWINLSVGERPSRHSSSND